MKLSASLLRVRDEVRALFNPDAPRMRAVQAAWIADAFDIARDLAEDGCCRCGTRHPPRDTAGSRFAVLTRHACANEFRLCTPCYAAIRPTNRRDWPRWERGPWMLARVE